jgi:hypothetical protein
MLQKKAMEEYLLDTLGEGEHSLQVCTPGPPSLVVIQDYGLDDAGHRAYDVEIIDPPSDNNIPLEWVVDCVAWVESFRRPRPVNNAKYRILPPLRPERYQALKNEIALNGVETPIIVDQHGNIIEGWHRWLACQELGIFCPTEVRYFTSEAEKFRLILSVNCNRRQMNRAQKRELIASYLKVVPDTSDNWLAETIGGVSKNRPHSGPAGPLRRQDPGRAHRRQASP